MGRSSLKGASYSSSCPSIKLLQGAAGADWYKTKVRMKIRTKPLFYHFIGNPPRRGPQKRTRLGRPGRVVLYTLPKLTTNEIVAALVSNRSERVSMPCVCVHHYYYTDQKQY
jgi:hypothetical protein